MEKILKRINRYIINIEKTMCIQDSTQKYGCDGLGRGWYKLLNFY